MKTSFNLVKKQKVVPFWKNGELLHFAELEELNGFAHVAIQVLDFIVENLDKQGITDLEVIRGLYAYLLNKVEFQINGWAIDKERLQSKNHKDWWS
jgi:hypothetical protein